MLRASSKSKAIATAWVSAALIASAIEPLVVKLGFQASATAFQLLVLKLLFGGIFIAPIYRRIKWIGADGLKKIFSASLLFVLTYVFMFYSLTHITAVVLVTIITTTPAVVALINQVRGHERPGIKFWTGFSFCFLGVLLTIDLLGASHVSLSGYGLALAFGSVTTSALYRTRMDVLTKAYKPITVSAYLFIINACLAACFIPWLGEVSAATWKVSAWIGFAGAIANVAFLSALHLIGSTRISILTVLQRPLVIVAAALILKEPLSLTQALGIAFVLVGIQLAKVTKRSLES